MNAHPAPLIDVRTSKDFENEVLAGLKSADIPITSGPALALVAVFARFCEIIVQRLNQAPDKARLAFLDMLGASILAPQPARVPLVFSLGEKSSSVALVPAGTQVGAIASAGDQEPPIFETEQDLVVTNARLATVAVRDIEHDCFTLACTGKLHSPLSLSRGQKRIRHMFSLREDTIFSCPMPATFTIDFTLADEAPEGSDPRSLHWELWDGRKAIPLTLDSDNTNGLTKSGTLNLALNSKRQHDASVHEAWIRCRLLTRITSSTTKCEGMVRHSHLPAIRDVSFEVRHQQNLTIEKAYTNTQALDTTKEFFPFGAHPKFGDTLYLAFDLFPVAGAMLVLDIRLVNPSGSDRPSPLPTTFAKGNPELRWEFWTGSRWQTLEPPLQDPGSSPENKFQDTARNLTGDGEITLVLPASPIRTKVNGVTGYWIRSTLISGNYGELAQPKPGSRSEISPATLAPPCVETIRVTYRLKLNRRPKTFTVCNAFVEEDETARFNSTDPRIIVFKPGAGLRLAIYFGFEMAVANDASGFLGRGLSMFLDITRPANRDACGTPSLTWEWWTEAGWTKCAIEDDTDSLTRPGLVRFRVPRSALLTNEFSRPSYWMRAGWQEGTTPPLSEIRGSYLNSTLATQTVTVRNELIGSSRGDRNQVFRLSRKLVVGSPQLQVWEPDKSDQDRNKSWEPWQRVSDFYESGPYDRHYVLDHLAGAITFGDGIHGMIPPSGTENLRIASYQTGGGFRGNMPSYTITELKTSLPYVEKVFNPVPASGGADAETQEPLNQRMPRTLRHGERALTPEDYEDLSLLASGAIARAHCVALYDLTDPARHERRRDYVSLILVPRSAEPEPMPDGELKTRVRSFLDCRRPPGAELVIVAPNYCRVGVISEIVIQSLDGASKTELEIRNKLSRFLHPTTGGPHGIGWDFNRNPNRSDFYGLIESTPGVKYVRALEIQVKKPQGFFVVSSGEHRINLVTE